MSGTQALQMSPSRSLCSTESAQPTDPVAAFSKGCHLSGCCGLAVITSVKENQPRAWLCAFSSMNTSKTISEAGTRTSKADRPIPKYNSLYVELHSLQSVFDLKYLFFILQLNNISVQIANTACERIHLVIQTISAKIIGLRSGCNLPFQID